ESHARAAAFVPDPSDVFIATVPKSGTTLLQMLCHAIRTQGLHTDFEDIYQVAPWDQMAWDLGQSLEAEQVARPRLFKSHLRLASLNRGAKYICSIREPEAVVRSWWRFLRQKDVPAVRCYTSISEFVYDKDYFAEGMRFGASLWDYYVEYAKCLDLPQLLVVCFEDLDSNLEGELPRLVEFLGLPPLDAEATQRVLHLCSRQSML
ncbi:SULT1C4, partial [Symbiodinium sp. CCMP2456]